MVKTHLKGKDPKKNKKNQPVAASKDKHRDMGASTGLGAGADFVNSASKFLASYGKFIMPVLALGVIGLSVWYFWQTHSTHSERELRNLIDSKTSEESLDKLAPAMEEAIATAEEEEQMVDYAWYRYAVRAHELLERPYKKKQLDQVIGIIGDAVEAQGDESAQRTRLEAMKSRLEADEKFLTGKTALLPWTKDSKPDKPEPRLVADTEPPIVVFVTSVGKLKFKLFEDDAPNAVKNYVSLVEEGYYDRTDFSADSFSNSFNYTGPWRGSTVFTAGSEGRPIGVELEKPTDANEDDDSVDTVPEQNPYTILYQGSSVDRFEPGTIAFTLDPDDPTRARAEFFVVLEPGEALSQNFKPLGKITDKSQLDTIRRLKDATIYYTYVEQKRKDVEYKPEVYYDGWPVPVTKRDKPPEPVRYTDVETEIVPANSKLNPIVAISTDKGDILIELFEDVVPNSVANYISLIEEGAYKEQASFYRVEGTGSDLAEIYKAQGLRIIQGGIAQDHGHDYVIKNEAVDNDKYEAAGVKNTRGTLAYARTNNLDSASTEFFINLKEMPEWDRKASLYCVFGRVLAGLDVASKIEANDKINSIKVIRRRDHEYMPTVKYKGESKWRTKDKVEPKKDEDKDDKKDE